MSFTSDRRNTRTRFTIFLYSYLLRLTDDVTSHVDILTDNMDTGVGSVNEGKLRDTHWKGSQTSAKSPKEERKWLHGQYLATAGWDSF